MKAMKMISTNRWLFLIAFAALTIMGCKKDKHPLKTPEVVTVAVTNITTVTATAGGTINSDGGTGITEAGVCFSNTNQTPTTADQVVNASATSGTFTAELTALTPGSTYYIRAFATNSEGTGYGQALTFMTGNAGPEAKNVTVTGDKNVGAVLTGSYTYSDAENNPEGGTTFQWYSANDSIGAAVTPIAGATAKTYTVVQGDKDKFLRFGVTPKASAGTSPGSESKSFWLGPIGGEVMTFMYNNASVTYGVITSSVTGRKWMDRNLGAKQAATSMRDHLGYGDLFQWGRLADGHQLITWNQNVGVGSNAPVNGTKATLSNTDIPGSVLFITAPNFPGDWRNPQNAANLWQSPNYINNPCPSGWHIPTKEEWGAEHIDITNGNELKITANGFRKSSNGSLADDSGGPGRQGWYWCASPVFYDGFGYVYGYYDFLLYADGTVARNFAYGVSETYGAAGNSCRCIKNL